MKITTKQILIAVLLTVSVGLAYDSMTTYMNPYLEVAEVAASPSKYVGKSLQVIGVVEPGSVELTNDGSINFVLIDEKGSSIKVTYRGIPPNNMEDEGNSVVVLGELGVDGELQSEELLVKCPSKYEGEEEDTGISHVFLAAMGIAVLGIGYLVITMFYKK
ncbi:cytochrome c maturation protein CcmE [Candidatus Bathyarchaeota archaeon]|nr:cytochrome c maturation protein CcmE [Candidatus Bathyarchaeota archaeon]